MLKWEIICSQERVSTDAPSQLVEQLLNCSHCRYAEHSRRENDCLDVFRMLDDT